MNGRLTAFAPNANISLVRGVSQRSSITSRRLNSIRELHGATNLIATIDVFVDEAMMFIVDPPVYACYTRRSYVSEPPASLPLTL